ncbi:MAG: hypothetical protein R3F07_03695 [Opitutaceae bacterium]
MRIVEILSNQELEIIDYMNWEVLTVGEDHRLAAWLSDFSLLGAMSEDGSGLFPVLYRSEDGDKVDLRIEGDLLYVNGNVRSIVLSGEENRNFATWFASVGREDLQSIDFVQVDEGNLARHRPELAAIAEASPNCSILDPDEGFTQTFGGRSKPLLVAPDGNTKLEGFDLGEVRLLLIDGGSSSADPSPLIGLSLPNLHGVYLKNGSGDSTVNLEAFPQIRALSAFGSIPVLTGLPELKTLFLNSGDMAAVPDLNDLPHPERLRYLAIAGTWAEVKGTDRLTGLEYLNPGTISETELEAVLVANPNLIFLDLIYAELTSLKPLAMAPRVEGIALGDIDSGLDLTPLRDLKHLRYIGLSETALDDPAIVAKVRESCPGCVVYGQDTFCLGSGWLLLALPVMALAILIKWVREKRV